MEYQFRFLKDFKFSSLAIVDLKWQIMVQDLLRKELLTSAAFLLFNADTPGSQNR